MTSKPKLKYLVTALCLAIIPFVSAGSNDASDYFDMGEDYVITALNDEGIKAEKLRHIKDYSSYDNATHELIIAHNAIIVFRTLEKMHPNGRMGRLTRDDIEEFIDAERDKITAEYK